MGAAIRTPAILVDVDGSAESETALRWALQESSHRGARVEALLAYQKEPAFVPAGPRAARRCAGGAGRGPRRTGGRETVVLGDAAERLTEATRHAELLVIGTRGRGALAQALLGGVAAKCLRHAECPVVVIPPRAVG